MAMHGLPGLKEEQCFIAKHSISQVECISQPSPSSCVAPCVGSSLLPCTCLSPQHASSACCHHLQSVHACTAALKGAVHPARPRREVQYVISELVHRLHHASDWLVSR